MSEVSKLKKQHMLSRCSPQRHAPVEGTVWLKFYEKLCTISGWDTFSIFYKLQLLLLKKFNVFIIFTYTYTFICISTALSPSSTVSSVLYSTTVSCKRTANLHTLFEPHSSSLIHCFVSFLYPFAWHKKLNVRVELKQACTRGSKVNVSWYVTIIEVSFD